MLHTHNRVQPEVEICSKDVRKHVNFSSRLKIIPSILGRKVSNLEQKIFSLPTRFEGLNLQDPVEMAGREYKWSRKLTEDLTEKIGSQMLADFDPRKAVAELRAEKKIVHEETFQATYNDSDDNLKRCLNIASEKGFSIWLNALSISNMGYCLNKVEFMDAIALRYNFKIKGVA